MNARPRGVTLLLPLLLLLNCPNAAADTELLDGQQLRDFEGKELEQNVEYLREKQRARQAIEAARQRKLRESAARKRQREGVTTARERAVAREAQKLKDGTFMKEQWRETVRRRNQRDLQGVETLESSRLHRKLPPKPKPLSRTERLKQAWNGKAAAVTRSAAHRAVSTVGAGSAAAAGVTAEIEAAAQEDRELSVGNAVANTAWEAAGGDNFELGRNVAEQEIAEGDKLGRSRAHSFGRALVRTGYEKVASPYKSSKAAYEEEARWEVEDAQREGRAASPTRVRLRGLSRSVGEATGVAELAEGLSYDQRADRRAVQSGRLLQTKTEAKVEISLFQLWKLQEQFNRVMSQAGAEPRAQHAQLTAIASQYRAAYVDRKTSILRIERKGLIDPSNPEYIALRQAFAQLPPELHVPAMPQESAEEQDLESLLSESSDDLDFGIDQAAQRAEGEEANIDRNTASADLARSGFERRTGAELDRSRANAQALGASLQHQLGSAAHRDAEAIGGKNNYPHGRRIDDGRDWDAVNDQVRGRSPQPLAQGGRHPGFTPPPGSGPMEPVTGRPSVPSRPIPGRDGTNHATFTGGASTSKAPPRPVPAPANGVDDCALETGGCRGR